MQETIVKARPFLKWAGGKTQLIRQITSFFPLELKLGIIKKYVEPFVGGGAVFFHVANEYPLDEFIISDINEELILSYRTIKKNVSSVISYLREYEQNYTKLRVLSSKSKFFYGIRKDFNCNRTLIDYNSYSESWAKRTAQIIFLNKTCFNGLFRLNSNGEFNVPFGRYIKPTICDTDNLQAVSELLQKTTIHLGDFTQCEQLIDINTLVYLDPPYRPLNKTSSFTSYSKYEFNDASQISLASFFRLLDKKGTKIILSNSDPKNENPHDHFFEDLYKGYTIERVKASRMINCNGNKRGTINELLILNY